MQVRLFLLCILFFSTTSFFWEDEEKQLQQLHQSGEAAMQKNEFEEAKVAFEELLGRISVNSSKKYRVDWPTYIDLVMRLAITYEELGEINEAEKVLDSLLIKNPPEELSLQAKLARARLSAPQTKPGDVYRQMAEIAKNCSTDVWNNKDLSFFRALEYSLNSSYNELLNKAKRFLTTGFYAEAIKIYNEILVAINQGSYPKALQENTLIIKKIRYRLAECHFLAADYEKTLAFCDQAATEDKIDREMLYLSALCFREKNEYEKALTFFQNYTQSGDRIDLAHYDHALFEIGYFYYQNGNHSKAKRYFEQLQKMKSKPSLVAAIYLARLLIEEGNPKQVEVVLASATKALGSKDPLRLECYFLRGVAAYTLKEYSQAKDFFERSLPSKSSVGKWYPHSLYHLGWCYLHLGDDPLKGAHVRANFFGKAEEMFEKLLNYEPEQASLALAQLHLLRYRDLEEKEALNQIDTLLENRGVFSLDGQIQALLIKADAAKNYTTKETFLADATDEKYKQTTHYAQAWYNRGLNHFQEGMDTPDENTYFFECAALDLKKAFRLMEKSDRKQAAHILKLEAKANIYRNSPITTLTLLEKLLSQFDETAEEKEETLYLRGLIASQLTDLTYFSVAEESLLHVINHYPTGKYIDDALHVLATLYYGNENYLQAKEMFVKLATDHPLSPYAPGAWFWAAEAASSLGENPTLFRSYVYEKYPKSEQAAEAHFRQYAYTDYFEGETQAVKHLHEFKSRFPHSPFLIVVHYLIGLNEEVFEKAKVSFKEALRAFELYSKKMSTPESSFVFFYYQTVLELASCQLNHDEMEESEKLLPLLFRNSLSKTIPLLPF